MALSKEERKMLYDLGRDPDRYEYTGRPWGKGLALGGLLGGAMGVGHGSEQFDDRLRATVNAAGDYTHINHTNAKKMLKEMEKNPKMLKTALNKYLLKSGLKGLLIGGLLGGGLGALTKSYDLKEEDN